MHLSDSSVQKNAEKVILRQLEKQMSLPEYSLVEKKVYLKDDSFVNFDGYNDDEGIIVEIYARIGKLAPSQEKKIVTDLMKMVLTERVLQKNFRKIIAVCDELVEKQITGSSWKSLAISEFQVEVIKVEIGSELRQDIIDTQKRQYR